MDYWERKNQLCPGLEIAFLLSVLGLFFEGAAMCPTLKIDTSVSVFQKGVLPKMDFS